MDFFGCWGDGHGGGQGRIMPAIVTPASRYGWVGEDADEVVGKTKIIVMGWSIGRREKVMK